MIWNEEPVLQDHLSDMTGRCQNCSDSSPHVPNTHMRSCHYSCRWRMGKGFFRNLRWTFGSSKKVGCDTKRFPSLFLYKPSLLTSAWGEQFARVSGSQSGFSALPSAHLQEWSLKNPDPTMARSRKTAPHLKRASMLPAHKNNFPHLLFNTITRFHCLREESHLSWCPLRL